MVGHKNNFKYLILFLIFLLLLSIGIGVAFGSSYIDIVDVYKFLGNKISGKEIFKADWKKTIEVIIWEVRVPRVLLSGICGAGLALCGVLMQCITKNPIADPYILGISSGASAGAVFVIVFGGTLVSITIGAFLGTILCGIIVFTVGTQWGKSYSTVRLILTGLAVSTIFSSLTNIFIYSADNANQVKSAVFWTMGSLGRAKWGKSELLLPLVILIIVFFISFFMSKSLDILILGDNSAKILGMDIAFIKVTIILLTTFLISVQVAITGAIGFIGLIVPHICRAFCGNKHKNLLVISIFIGAIFLIWCDIGTRVLFPPKEIPIGIITSIIGGPFFLLMINKNRFSFGGEKG